MSAGTRVDGWVSPPCATANAERASAKISEALRTGGWYHPRNRRTMARFERLLIPIIAAVMVAAFFLEDLGAVGVRRIALGLGILLIVALVVGLYHRVRKKLSQTSNDPGDKSAG